MKNFKIVALLVFTLSLTSCSITERLIINEDGSVFHLHVKPEWLADKRHYFLNVRRTLGLPKIDECEFAYEFRLQTLQRCLKAAGTFSYQSAVRRKTYFIQYIQPMFKIVYRSGSNLDRFPNLLRILEREIADFKSA